MPPGHAAVVVDVDLPLSTAPMPQALMGALSVLPDLLAAFRSGAGIPYERFGLDMCAG
jgi:hypothetical protein